MAAKKSGGASVKPARKPAGKPAGKPGIPRGRLNSPELVKLLLTVEETAHKLSVSPATVYRVMARGELCYITVGRVRRVPVEAVGEYVAAQRRAMGHPAA